MLSVRFFEKKCIWFWLKDVLKCDQLECLSVIIHNSAGKAREKERRAHVIFTYTIKRLNVEVRVDGILVPVTI